MPDRGRLSVVGTGIRPGGHLTTEARHVLAAADDLFVLADSLTLSIVQGINPVACSLQQAYMSGRQRDASYADMVARIVAPVHAGRHVCAAFYGHPGVFVWPSHEAVRQVRAAGLPATLYPGVSAEDCLFADLGLDPAVHGCQSFEAMDFLLYARRYDPTAALVLWQPAALGDVTRSSFSTDAVWVRALAKVLGEEYPATHLVTIYEAAVFPLDQPRREQVALGALHTARFTQLSTLYLPPAGAPSLCRQRLQLLGLDASDLAAAAFQQYREGLQV